MSPSQSNVPLIIMDASFVIHIPKLLIWWAIMPCGQDDSNPLSKEVIHWSFGLCLCFWPGQQQSCLVQVCV